MGVQVKTLATADLTDAGLKNLDAIVIGVRAFNVRDDLAPNGARSRRLLIMQTAAAPWSSNTTGRINCAIARWPVCDLSFHAAGHR